MRSRLVVALFALLSAGPALAGGVVTLGCGDWRQEFLVGTGRQFRGQGLEVWPMLCLTTGKVGSYSRVMDPENFARLEAAARQKAANTDRVADWMRANPRQTAIPPGMFGQVEELTFGDLRASVENAARPTEETILTTRFVFWTHPACASRLVPFDYYLETGTACPACGGGKLGVLDGGNRSEWD